MPRNYDEIRDKTDDSFIIRGQTFKLRRTSPEELGKVVALEREWREAETTYEQDCAFFEKRFLMLIDDSNGAADRWKDLRAKNEITYGEIVDLSIWASEQMTHLPTLRPSPSEPGPSKTAATSKAG